MATPRAASEKSKTGDLKKNVLPAFSPRAERLSAGKRLRDTVPRDSHASWKMSKQRRDPVKILEDSSRQRLSDLVPIRYGRMLASPFTFLRGSAALMAYDLSNTPNTGVYVQACGDCHLLNFGLFATPERNLVFDINDFDETLPAPWEWDVKRLAVSFAVAARDNRLSDTEACEIATICARAYREQLREYSCKSALDMWYARLDAETLIAEAPDAKARKLREEYANKAHQRIVEHLFPKIARTVGDRHRLVDQPPILFHVAEEGFEERVHKALAEYRLTLPDDRRILLDRYRLEDCALKVVGIGSVGTRCYIGLFFDEEDNPLMLQFKEACPSVLERYTKKCRYKNQGQRVVSGQRLMQSSSDIFLGWARDDQGKDFFARQLRDMKFSVPVEGLSAVQLQRYAVICGGVLARAHAKSSGNAATISGYLGKGESFDQALGTFAVAYADQNDKDYSALVEAVRSGRVQAIRDQ